MDLPQSTIAVSPERVAELTKKLGLMRHNVNNHLALVVAACELIRRKPEMAERLLETIQQQPPRINSELRAFAEDCESLLNLKGQAAVSGASSMPATAH